MAAAELFHFRKNLHNNANKLSTKHSCNYLEAELCPGISHAYFLDISLGHFICIFALLAAHLMLKCLNWILYLFSRKRKPFRHSYTIRSAAVSQIEIFKCHGSSEVTTVLYAARHTIFRWFSVRQTFSDPYLWVSQTALCSLGLSHKHFTFSFSGLSFSSRFGFR